MLDDSTRLALVAYMTNHVNYEAIGSRGQGVFWERVLVVALDKHRLVTEFPQGARTGA